MQVTLPPELEKFIRDQVDSGHFSDEADVIREALRRLSDEADHGRRLERLRAAVAVGLEQADRSELVDYDFDALTTETEASDRRRDYSMEARM